MGAAARRSRVNGTPVREPKANAADAPTWVPICLTSFAPPGSVRTTNPGELPIRRSLGLEGDVADTVWLPVVPFELSLMIVIGLVITFKPDNRTVILE